jgi:hypothetical protein
MTAAAVGRERFDMGRVVQRTFGSIGRNAVTFLVLALALYGAPGFLLQVVSAKLNPAFGGTFQAADPGAALGFAGLLLLTGIVSWILTALLQAAVVHGVVADADGRKASLDDCLGTGLRFVLPVAGVGLVTGLGVFFGFLFFIVPGLMLWMAWSVAVPAAVAERTGVFGAIARSGELTRGHRWSIFGLAFVAFVVLMVVSAVFAAITFGTLAFGGDITAQMTSVPRLLANTASGTIMSIVTAAGIASVYIELRTIKEGVGATALASVFD